MAYVTCKIHCQYAILFTYTSFQRSEKKYFPPSWNKLMTIGYKSIFRYFSAYNAVVSYMIAVHWLLNTCIVYRTRFVLFRLQNMFKDLFHFLASSNLLKYKIISDRATLYVLLTHLQSCLVNLAYHYCDAIVPVGFYNRCIIWNRCRLNNKKGNE